MMFFFFNDSATTDIYTLSLHDALPIFIVDAAMNDLIRPSLYGAYHEIKPVHEIRDKLKRQVIGSVERRSEEHTSELQSHSDLVCRLLLEKKKTNNQTMSVKHPKQTPST